MAALAFQAWRSLRLEAGARALELERAELLAERILRQAPGSRAVMERVSAAQRFVLRGDGVVEDAAVGWHRLVPAKDDADLVVQDRLDRAARAEFGGNDRAGAERAFDELLAVPLPATQRLVVLAAAAWQCRRAGDQERLALLRRQLDERLGALRGEDVGREAVAQAVAATLRLARDEALPAWAARLVPFLPEAVVADLPLPEALRAAQRAAIERRELCVAADREWRALAQRGAEGLIAVGGGHLLWWLPRADGSTDGARLPIAQWLALVRDAGRAGELPVWPWLVEADVDVEVAGGAFAGVPHVRGLRAVVATGLGAAPWLLPAAIGVLLLAFAFAMTWQFRAAQSEAAAVRTQAEFLTTVTHELKTPLASIRLLGEMLAEGRAAGRETDYYRMLASEAGRLSMLIENVLDLGRLERGERACDLRRHDVGEVVRETVALVAPLGRLDGAEVVLRDAEGLWAQIDRGALVQALISVLDNARKYGAGPIEIETAGFDGTLRVGVRDHGAGVAAAERERIFERFVRGSPHRHGSTPGVGIGLYLARAIARRLRGDLVCTSPLDGGPGALFLFTLPMENPA